MKRSPALTKDAPAKANAPEVARVAANRLEGVLAYVLVMAAGAAFGFTILVFVIGYTSTLFADSWTVLMDFRDAGFRFSPSSLVLLHNEHRPLFARIFILIDFLWLGARGSLPFAVIFLTQATQAWLLWTIAVRQSWFGRHYRTVVISYLIFCCFSATQMENFYWGFQTAFVLNFLFATCATVGVVAQKESGSPKWSALVFTGILCAPLCLGSGAFVWVVVVVLSLIVRLPVKWISIYAGVGLATLLAYLHGYKSYLISPVDALKKPVELITYAGHFFGSAWKGWPMLLGELLTIAALVLLGIRVYGALRRAPVNPWDAAPLGLMMFSLGTGLLASLARVGLGAKQAESTRYQTPALLFWFGAALLLLALLPKDAPQWRLGFEAFLALGMISSFSVMPEVIEQATTFGKQLNVAGAAWVSGVQDHDMLQPMLAGDQLDLYWPYREHGYGPFWRLERSQLGEIQSGDYCSGHFSRERFFGGDSKWPGIRLRGAARRNRDWLEVRQFIATDYSQHVLGVGVDGVVFAATPNEHERIIVYGLPEKGKACAISTDQ